MFEFSSVMISVAKTIITRGRCRIQKTPHDKGAIIVPPSGPITLHEATFVNIYRKMDAHLAQKISGPNEKEREKT